ncbi:bifunctional UDP-N-acetylglucosamine diphosphorylase/glucosamine-1-phosphate N-acetyltransferase GlmU [Mechercharimyces sp. CAU 1602]|uniref:bifunctional UDP-N-acetylglucosamine diphosphorylase/glucosamine-1-phosphate N-acetyltransferase GlmU n=1 Tax=Mechercharimyces sp. CAU 1602 TaxID=2973933 RepID=UPI0021617C76|nr:bifunctional UDP-N-acetylglucosamine diphosphorylase/glucosamine-1-phosphate N-acetyltransferase GlmU [Mechercharimyces sp. CAU 1602]MCS1352376.1 bifunctional UDP-N-acetylglucosamine diphosphorylase/glucosamine-1-phosphate N-acetyltransferase GlmU [Mechercharimyces sp. CAU 1602]
MDQLQAVVLAAGQGTRMKSNKHKVLHKVCGKPMIDYIVDSLQELGIKQPIIVTGYQSEALEEHLGERALFVRQEEQLGTAHAVMQAKELLAEKQGTTLVMHGDHPLFTTETLERLIHHHREQEAAATILTATLPDPTGYGRVIRGEDQLVDGVVEQKDASEEERAICEVNTGTYCFDNEKLLTSLSQVSNDNAQGEYYLPDVITILRSGEERVEATLMDDVNEAHGVNHRVQLAEAEKIMRRRILHQHMVNGVTIIDPDNTYVEAGVTIGSDTVIHPGTHLRGATKIGSDCTIGPQADLTNVVIADSVTVQYSVVLDSQLGEGVNVGPYARIRPGSKLEKQAKVGCFIDMKNAHIGEGTKVPHHAYIGDAKLGKKVNIGCGTITVNYDGRKKQQTVIADGAFVGCNVNLIAPVSVGEGAYVAAGSSINQDVPADGFAIARQRQTVKPQYVKRMKDKL